MTGPSPPASVGPYRIRERIAEGSMSVVHAATDLRDGGPIAVKFLPDEMLHDRWRRKRLREEYRFGKGFRHRNLVDFLDFREEASGPYLFMERIDGPTLRTILETESLSDSERLEIAKGIAAALHYIHESDRMNRLVHGDLKPENVLLRGTERPYTRDRTVLIDFGTMLVARHRIVGSGWIREVAWRLFGGRRVIGCSPLYMSPEQAGTEPIAPQSDIYSFGVLLYEMFTGRPPFLTDAEERELRDGGRFFGSTHERAFHNDYNRELQFKHREMNPVPPRTWNPTLPAPVEETILRCMRKDPGNRYDTALELLSALTRMEFGRDGTFTYRGRGAGTEPVPADAPVALSAVLRVLKGPQRGETASVQARPLKIGRDPMGLATLAFPDDPEVSAEHAIVHRMNNEYSVSDLGSTNGTLVNGQRIRGRRRLKDGDRIQIGRNVIRIQVERRPVPATLERKIVG